MSKLDQALKDKVSKFNIGQFKAMAVESPSPVDTANWNSFTIGIDENNSKLYIKGKVKTFTVNLTEF